MSLAQSQISEVRVSQDGAELFIRWDSTAPWGTTYQVYVDRKLSWNGLSKACHVPLPARANARNVWIEVGSVAAGEATTDFSGALANPGGNLSRACLSWDGGTYLDASGTDGIHGYHVYMSSDVNQPVDFSAPVASVPAYSSGVITDGYGIGAYGAGGFGRAASSYKWQSDSLATGVWQFAVRPFDQAGNEQTTQSIKSVSINAAPRPPATNSQGARLGYSYSGSAQRTVTLSWQPCPA